MSRPEAGPNLAVSYTEIPRDLWTNSIPQKM